MTERDIADFTNQQLKNLLISNHDVTPYVKDSLDRTLSCFEPNNNKYYARNRNISVFHSGQYSIYLYYLANTIYKKSGDTELASKIYYLNKILHSVDWFYAIELPSYWGVEHPVGSVLGRAKYDDGLFIYQGCTVGGNKKRYPSLGRNVIMYSNSTILGNCNVGDNVIIATGTTVKDQDIPNNSIVFGESPNLVIKEKSEESINELIDEIWIRNRGVS
jgi:serine O-acetyltransferase